MEGNDDTVAGAEEGGGGHFGEERRKRGYGRGCRGEKSATVEGRAY